MSKFEDRRVFPRADLIADQANGRKSGTRRQAMRAINILVGNINELIEIVEETRDEDYRGHISVRFSGRDFDRQRKGKLFVRFIEWTPEAPADVKQLKP